MLVFIKKLFNAQGFWEAEDDHWIQLQASVVVVEPTEGSGEAADPDVEARVESFNRRVSAWRFQIPAYKFDALSKRSEDLLQPLEEGTGTETP